MARFTTLVCGAMLATSPLVSALPQPGPGKPPVQCRWAPGTTQEQVLKSTAEFEDKMLYWEGKFHQNGVAYNSLNGMTYDGTLIDWKTGEPTQLHTFSAASKEVSLSQAFATVFPLN